MNRNWRLVQGIFIVAIFAASAVIGLCPLDAATLSGKIIDGSSGEALYRATVAIESIQDARNNDGTLTDQGGKFQLAELIPGNYRVIVSYVGFVPQELAVTIPETNDPPLLQVRMIPTAINVDAVTVTTSRRPEKLLEAPAAVSVIDAATVEARSTLTPTEHLKGVSAVDVATTGLNQSSAVVRGFNDIFSGALLVLADNRIARVPSLRFNAYNFISTTNDDIERIEIVSGPGSALYGPNAADGVMHIISKSPFSSQGTIVSVGGGERDLVTGSFRHAGSSNSRVGYKLSARYYQGNDWEWYDRENEPDSVRLYRQTVDGREYVGGLQPNERDFEIKKISADGRLDFLLNQDMSLIINGGFNRGNSIELTGLGAAQAINWTYLFGQARYMYKDLFIQGFVNASDAGDTYLLRTGQLIVDKSKLWGAQVQHRYEPAEPFSLTYGIDALFTRPNTEATINGRNEEDDNINELGVYLQSETWLNEKFKLVTAARVDNHNKLENLVVSPRAALSFQPNPNQNLRFTYNRAYNTPDNNNFYLDILQAEDPFGVGAGFASALGFSPNIDIRVQGVPETGFHWRVNENGAQFRSPFAPLAGLSSSDFIDFNDPAFTNVMWTAGKGAVQAGFAAELTAKGLPEESVNAMVTSLAALTPSMITGVDNKLRIFNPNDPGFEEFSLDDLHDIERLKPTITQTFEIGHKGIIGERLRFSIDAYHSLKKNFVGPLTVETPNVFLDDEDLTAALATAFAAALADPENAVNAATLASLDENGDGLVDDLVNMYVSGVAPIPFGTVSPLEALDPEALLITYRNFGDISYSGTDLSLAYHLNRNWNVSGTYSYISDNLFKKGDNQAHDIHLNAPRNKFGLALDYTNPEWGLTAQSRFRHVDAFDMSSPYVGTTVEAYDVVDFNVGFEVMDGTRASLTVQNILDNKHVEFIGAPEVGRLAILRMSKTF